MYSESHLHHQQGGRSRSNNNPYFSIQGALGAKTYASSLEVHLDSFLAKSLRAALGNPSEHSLPDGRFVISSHGSTQEVLEGLVPAKVGARLPAKSFMTY